MLTKIYHEISFPDLGISIDPSTGLEFGSFSIRWYGVVITLGLLLAVIYACRRSKQFGLTEDHILDGVLWVTPFAIICARAYYCIFSWELYADNPISCLYIWQGGLAIYGGIIGAAIGILVFCKVKKIKVGAVLDLVALGFLIGQCIGRWGNFFNREAFGTETDFFLRMGLTDEFGYTIYVHPTFLYESLWNLLGFVMLHFLSKHRKYDGQTALQYAAWYGAGRALIEGLRTDSLYISGTDVRVSQLLSVVLCVAALAYLIIFHFAKHDPEKLYVNMVARRTEEEAALLAALMAEEAGEDGENPESMDGEMPAMEETSVDAEGEVTADKPAGEETAEAVTDEETIIDEEPAGEEVTEGEPTEEAPAKRSLWQKFDAWLRS